MSKFKRAARIVGTLVELAGFYEGFFLQNWSIGTFYLVLSLSIEFSLWKSDHK